MNRTSWIFIIITLLICSVISFFLIRPVVSSSWKTYKDTQAAKKDLDEISKRKEVLNELSKNSQLSSLYDTAVTYIPQDSNSGALVIELSAIANNAKMKVEQVSLESTAAPTTPQEDTSKTKPDNSKTPTPAPTENTATAISEIPFTMKLTGTFTDFQKFLQDIETSSRLITISGMNLSQNEAGLTVSISGKTYWKKGSNLEKTLANIQISKETIELFKNLKTYGTPINPAESGFGRTDPFATF